MNKKISHRLFRTLFFVTTVMALSLIVFPVAAKIAPLDSGDCGDLGIACTEDASSESLITIILNIIKVFLTVVALIAAIVVIYGGLTYILSAGEANKAEKAKNIIVYAILGLIVIGLSFVLVNFVIGAISGEGDGGAEEETLIVPHLS